MNSQNKDTEFFLPIQKGRREKEKNIAKSKKVSTPNENKN